jgi:hypothetical protein
MPKWWPWGRHQEPVAPAAPAARPEPVWQRLAAVTPTTGDIEPTAHLNGFTATLTTSQNPAFTRPVQLLAVDEHHRLPVLDTGPAQPVPPPATPAAAPQSRSWAPRLPSVQRAHVGTPVQRNVAQDEPAAASLPVIEAGEEPESARAMVQASDPDERRPLDTVTDEVALAPSALPMPSPATSDPVTVASSAVEHPAPTPPAVQRLATDTSPLPAVVQRAPEAAVSQPVSSSTATSGISDIPAVQVSEAYRARHTEIATPPLRHLHTVQRTDAAAPTIPMLVPLPVVTSTPKTPVTRPEHDAPKPQPVTAIQRTPDTDEPIADVADDSEQPAPAVNLLVVDERDGDAPMPAQTAVATPTPSVLAPTPSHAPAAVQRLMPQPSPSSMPRPAPSVPSSPSISPTPIKQRSTPAPALRTESQATPSPDTTTTAVEPADLPVVTAQPVMDESAPTTEHYEAPVAQRSSTVAFTAAETHPEPVSRVQPVSVVAATQLRPPTVMRTVGDAPRAASKLTTPVTGAARPPVTPDAIPAPDSPVAQRISLPVAHTAPAPPTRRPEPSTPPLVQRSTGSGRRLVVLPPVRSTDDHGSSPGVAAHPPDGAEVFSSPRPVGLQRMFEAGTPRVSPPLQASVAAVESPAAAPTSERRSSMDTAQSTVHAHEYDDATNTITFGSPGLPSIQRATDGPAPAAETAAPVTAAPAVTSVSAGSGSGGPAAAGTDVDELVNRVYDALAARLRAELWLDRERAGTLMDLGR